MVSEETPAAEAEAPTKPLFTKIGYDNEVKKIGYDDEVKIQKLPLPLLVRCALVMTWPFIWWISIFIFSGGDLHPEEGG